MNTWAYGPLLALWWTTLAVARTDALVSEASPAARVRDPAPWTEAAVQLPAWPRAEDLLAIRLTAPHGQVRYFLDTRSLTVAGDGSVRYTVVTVTPSGTRQIVYEGLLCTPRGEYKRFAYGSDGRFVLLTDSDWQPLAHSGEPYREELWRHYLCVPQRFAPRIPLQ